MRTKEGHMSTKEDHLSTKDDHMSTKEDHTSTKEEDRIVLGGTFAGVGDFSAVSATVSYDHYSNYGNMVKDDSACIR